MQWHARPRASGGAARSVFLRAHNLCRSEKLAAYLFCIWHATIDSIGAAPAITSILGVQ